MSNSTLSGGGETLSLELVNLFQSRQGARYAAAAATTLYIYDILITSGLEVEYTLPRLGFNLHMLFYILNRYVSLIFFLFVIHELSDLRDPLSDTYCKAPLYPLGIILAHTSWTGVMTIRVCALWKQRTKLVILVWTLWALTIFSVVICGLLGYITRIPAMSYQEVYRKCLPDVPLVGVQVAGQWSPIVVATFETFLTILTIVKAYDFHTGPGYGSLPLFYRVLARDGSLYLLVSVAITTVTLVCWFTRPGVEFYIFALIYWSLLSTVISRLALNLRQRLSESWQVTMTSSFGITNPDGTNVEFKVFTDFGRRGKATTEDFDYRAAYGRPVVADSAAADTERVSPTISEPDELEEGDQGGIHQRTSLRDPPLAMWGLNPRQSGTGAV